ncbi:MAG TPA: hypothetical protein VGC88_06645 [Terriglobales bacterium]|jgi:hypothetical protein
MESLQLAFLIAAMFLVAVANICGFVVIERLGAAGLDIGNWKSEKDWTLCLEYWNIAPRRGWSRSPLVMTIVTTGLALLLLLASLSFTA